MLYREKHSFISRRRSNTLRLKNAKVQLNSSIVSISSEYLNFSGKSLGLSHPLISSPNLPMDPFIISHDRKMPANQESKPTTEIPYSQLSALLLDKKTNKVNIHTDGLQMAHRWWTCGEAIVKWLKSRKLRNTPHSSVSKSFQFACYTERCATCIEISLHEP